MQNIYVLNLLRVEERTEESFEKELKLENFKYNRETTMERYKERVFSWNKFASKYKLDCVEENSYFLNLFDAQFCARTNLADINEAGVYNYVCIMGYRIGLMYGSCEPETFYLYCYDREKDEYVEIDSNEDVYKFVAIEMGASFLSTSHKEDASNLFKEDVIPNIDSFSKKYHFDVVNDIYLFMYHFGLAFDCLRLDATKYNHFYLSLPNERDGISLDWYVNNDAYHFIFASKEDESYCIMSWLENDTMCSKKMKMEQKDYSYIAMKILLRVRENEK